LGAIRQLTPGTRELPLPNARYADADLDPEQFIARPLTHRLAFSPDGRRALLWLELRGIVRKDKDNLGIVPLTAETAVPGVDK